MRKLGGLNVKCRVCGKEFYIRPYFSREDWGKYYSKKCKDESQKTGQYVICAYCGEKVYRTLADLRRESKTKTYFCNKSCQCAWKNKRRKNKNRIGLLKNLWGSWCNSSIRVCGALGTDANSADPPFRFLKFLKRRKKKTTPLFFIKPPSKKSSFKKLESLLKNMAVFLQKTNLLIILPAQITLLIAIILELGITQSKQQDMSQMKDGFI